MKLTIIASLVFLSIYTHQATAQTGSCEPGMAEAYLDANNVRARIPNNGGLFWRGSPHVYEVPKYGNANAIFAASLWIGGLVDDEVRIAATCYGPWEFWPGPLDAEGNPPENCAPFDRVYSIYLRDINEYEEHGLLTDDLRDWPWELGAPVVDGDGNPNNYNLAGGDRPEIIGHQTLWWVMNDRGNIHEATGNDYTGYISNPMGLEIQVTAFAAASDNIHIDNATLYKYKLIYKGDRTLNDTYFGIFQDADLGNFDDDYVGADTLLSLAYTYNADNDDEGEEGYGVAPPAVGFTVVQGPLADSDRDGATYEDGDRLPMTTFLHYNGGGGVNGDPEIGPHYYNYLSGRWKDGKSFTIGGTGRDFSDMPTSFLFPGDPVTGEGWTELNPDPFNNSFGPISPADRRAGLGTGPFTMEPGQVQEIVIAVVWARGEDNLDSITKLREASVQVREAFEAGFEIELPNQRPLLPVEPNAPANLATMQPTNPTLRWHTTDTGVFYQVEWSPNSTFENANIEDVIGTTSLKLSGLSPESTYFWRVRSVDAGERGPWSETWQFNTANLQVSDRPFSNFAFMAVQNANGPIEPPDMAAFAFNSSGFPVLEGNLTPVGSYPNADRPTRWVQQSLNNSAWGIHAGANESILFENNDGTSFIENVLQSGPATLENNNYEWRFTQHCLDQINGTIEQEDCLAFRGFEDSLFVEVPFALWDVGVVEDSTDDYRMIPFICETACGAGLDSMTFDFFGDHGISGGANDPFSDWIYWYKPADNGAMAGEQGYHRFFFGDMVAGDEVFAQMVLVQWNGGEEPPYDVAMPEPGTIFRIKTDLTGKPLLSAPANNELRTTKQTSFHWNAPEAVYQLQVATSSDFDSPVLDIGDVTTPFYSTEVLEDNLTYYWRVRMFSTSGVQISNWSDSWQFTIPLNVGQESDAIIPLKFALSQSYPNPFHATTQIRYAIPEASVVKLEVFDTLGRRVRVLVNETQPAGWHEATFSADGLSSGVYFYRLTADTFIETKTIILTK